MNRPGFTIVEVLLALLLLGFTIMGFQAATGEITHYSAQSDREATAIQAAEDRLNLIRLDPEYEGIGSRYAEEGAAVPRHPGLTRTTLVDRTRSVQDTGVLDYTTITVRVEGAGLRTPIARTIVVAAP